MVELEIKITLASMTYIASLGPILSPIIGPQMRCFGPHVYCTHTLMYTLRKGHFIPEVEGPCPFKSEISNRWKTLRSPNFALH